MSVWYCEELDDISVHYVHEGFLFCDKHGPFHVCYDRQAMFIEKWTHKFYWIGDFD